MRYVFCLILFLCPAALIAQDWEDHKVFAGASGAQTLRVLSSTDTSFFAPIIQNFLRDNPGLNIEYMVSGTADIFDIFQRDPDKYDLVISSAMDLQLKLANDGYALRIDGLAHPDWAHWRQSLFAFTMEPAAVVINRAAFAGRAVPKTRQELIQALRATPDIFRNRIGTYDVRQSGLGYLFATQDARSSETYWRLMEVMGSLGTRLYCCSGEMIDDLADGTIAVAYNVLGSYALARRDMADRIEVILPSDFPTTMMRTVFVSRETGLEPAATAFLRHLITRQPADPENEVFPLPSLATGPQGPGQSTIPLEPALMIYLDDLKRATFLKEWESAIIQ